MTPGQIREISAAAEAALSLVADWCRIPPPGENCHAFTGSGGGWRYVCVSWQAPEGVGYAGTASRIADGVVMRLTYEAAKLGVLAAQGGR